MLRKTDASTNDGSKYGLFRLCPEHYKSDSNGRYSGDRSGGFKDKGVTVDTEVAGDIVKRAIATAGYPIG